MGIHTAKSGLTEKEKEVVFYLAMGNTNKEIAANLNVSVHTVKAHLEAVYEKLEVVNRLQAVIRALQLKLINLESISVEYFDVESRYR